MKIFQNLAFAVSLRAAPQATASNSYSVSSVAISRDPRSTSTKAATTLVSSSSTSSFLYKYLSSSSLRIHQPPVTTLNNNLLPFHCRSMDQINRFTNTTPTTISMRDAFDPPSSPTFIQDSATLLAAATEAWPRPCEDYIRSGTLFQEAQLHYDPELWERLAARLIAVMKNQASLVRVYRYYVPVFLYMVKVMNRVREATGKSNKTVVIGISCPQGGGKTTLVTYLQVLFEEMGLRAADLSIDDIYLTRQQQQELANKHKDNALLQYRGNPGSHDIQLGIDTLKALTNSSSSSSSSALVPRYDKSAFQGLGDRAPVDKWTTKSLPLDVVLFEGWCLGFLPQDQDASFVSDQVKEVNHYLKTQFIKLYEYLDALVVIQIQDANWVYEWRAQAERVMRDAGKPAMTEEQIKDFVDRFMPSYKQYLSKLHHGSDVIPGHTFRIAIDQNRCPL